MSRGFKVPKVPNLPVMSVYVTEYRISGIDRGKLTTGVSHQLLGTSENPSGTDLFSSVYLYEVPVPFSVRP